MNIAVFLPNWVGDVVMATPAVRALRAHFRTARLIGVVKPYVADVLEGSPWFDAILPAPTGARLELAALAWKLRRARIDMGILFPNSFRVGLAAWLGGCKQRVGYARYGRGPLLTDVLQPLREGNGQLSIRPVVDAYNRLAEHVGCSWPGHDLELFTTPADEAGANHVWERGQLGKYPEVVCLNPGAAFGSAKLWPTDHFITLAGKLVRERGCAVLVLCGPGERNLAQQIASGCANPAVHSLADLVKPTAEDTTAPRLCIGLTKACVRRCDLLVTTDSGPRHFAAAFDRPVVTLFGPTHIAWTETYHPRAVHLQKQVDCGPCQRRVCPLDHRCMKGLAPGEVLAAADGLLS
jgi:heptosyltransferase-2